MAYQVLARKWRPKKFQELIGQEHVVSVLVNALSKERLHHAYLFTGTRGVGKTTIARIFAKSLNCQQGISSEPCGQCDICLDIDQGRFVDLLEIDAASRTKVDDTREILDNVQYAPSRGRYKVYLIDEVHMLSRSSFNALLKTLEEPPAHVKFILATTDPQKLPITVLSRCLQFHLKALTVEQIKHQLINILDAETVTYEVNAVALLAKAARGSMRDSLSLMDQAIAQGAGHVALANVQQMLGGIDQNWPYKIVIALIKQDSQALLALSKEIASYAPNYSRLFAELIQLFHQIALAQLVESTFDLAPEHVSLLQKFTQALSPETVQLYYQITLNGRKDLPYASDEQAAFDMTLLRLFAFKPMQASNLKQVTVEAPAINFDEKLPATNIEQSAPVKASKPENVQPVTSIPSTAEETTENLAQDNLQITQYNEIASEIVNEQDNLTLFEAQLSNLQDNSEQFFDADYAEPNDADKLTSEALISKTQAPETINTQAPETIALPTVKVPTSTTEAILAQRNMLRSKKKQLEQSSKKSDSANAALAQENQIVAPVNAEVNKQAVPEVSELTEKNYHPDIIDPAKVRLANQVDKWAHMIDTMALNGRLRQLAIHATISPKSTAELLILELNQETKHMYTASAHQQLEQAISSLLQKNITVEVNIVEDTVADPFKIQKDINNKRFEYARELLKSDPVVNYLQNTYQAVLDEDSIIAK